MMWTTGDPSLCDPSLGYESFSSLCHDARDDQVSKPCFSDFPDFASLVSVLRVCEWMRAGCEAGVGDERLNVRCSA